MSITYSILDCALGRVLVGATERGICAVSLGDLDVDLGVVLREEYPLAATHRADQAHPSWVEAIVRHLDGDRRDLSVPLDLQATPFQWRVWDALRAIPYGETRTYRQVAEDLGVPRASRAVGHACATNPVAVVIPCHRVLRTDGGLGGYRWGLERKKALLERERAVASSIIDTDPPPERAGGARPAAATARGDRA